MSVDDERLVERLAAAMAGVIGRGDGDEMMRLARGALAVRDAMIDERLVEAICRDRCRRAHDYIIMPDETRPAWMMYRRHVLADIAVINASGTHWIAPWDLPRVVPITSAEDKLWAKWRDAYLAEQGRT